jgi:predicted nucleic acid-binding Zn ribbon protein
MNPIFSPPLSVRDSFSSSPVTLKDGSQVTKAELVTTMMGLNKIKDTPGAPRIWHSSITEKPIVDLWGSDLGLPNTATRLNILSDITREGHSSKTHEVTTVARRVIRNAVVFDGANFVVIDPRKSSHLLESSATTTASRPSSPAFGSSSAASEDVSPPATESRTGQGSVLSISKNVPKIPTKKEERENW